MTRASKKYLTPRLTKNFVINAASGHAQHDIPFMKMSSPRRRHSLLHRTVMTTAAILIAAAQVMIAILPMVDLPRGAGERIRVEVPTSSGHYIHDEASCATCQVLHGYGLLQQLPPLATLVSWRAESHRNAWHPVASAEVLLVNSRGPPV